MTIEPDAIQSWRAADWDELRLVWSKLQTPPEPSSLDGQLLTAQQAGWLFERTIMEAFRLEGLTIHYPYEVKSRSSRKVKEQIDGIVAAGWQGFLIESKFQKKPVDVDPIFRLHMLAERRPTGTLGLFFSKTGFTEQAVESVEILKSIRVLLFEGVDLEWAFSASAPSRMKAMIKSKWLLALKLGDCQMPVAKYDGETGNPVVIPTDFEGVPSDEAAPKVPTDHGEPA